MGHTEGVPIHALPPCVFSKTGRKKQFRAQSHSHQTTAENSRPTSGRIMLLNSMLVEPAGAGAACLHTAMASGELQARILVPPQLQAGRQQWFLLGQHGKILPG